MLSLKNVSKNYDSPGGQVSALSDITLKIEKGDFVAVRGSSGCGKTTLLLSAGGLLKPSGGEVLVDAVNPYSLSPKKRAQFRAEKIGFVFQQFHLLPYLTVFENILTPAIAYPTGNAKEKAKELLGQFGLGHRQDHLPSQLSTGEKQRTALARALLNHPTLLLADEPTGNLDEKNSQIVLEALSDFAKNGGAVLMVTHDPAAAQTATRQMALEELQRQNGEKK